MRIGIVILAAALAVGCGSNNGGSTSSSGGGGSGTNGTSSAGGTSGSNNVACTVTATGAVTSQASCTILATYDGQQSSVVITSGDEFHFEMTADGGLAQQTYDGTTSEIFASVTTGSDAGTAVWSLDTSNDDGGAASVKLTTVSSLVSAGGATEYTVHGNASATIPPDPSNTSTIQPVNLSITF